jgi:hypothetical protein
VTRTDIELPKCINSHVDWSSPCPTNKEYNKTSAEVFKSHVMKTHTSVESNALPPDHTIVIEKDFQTSNKNKSSSLRVTNTLHRYCMHVEMPTSNTVHTTILIQFSVYTRESN